MAKKKTVKKKGTKAEKVKFDTSTQVGVSAGGGAGRSGVGALTSRTPAGLSGERTAFDLMLKDPTIKLACDIISAMLTRQPWSVITTNKEHEEFASLLLTDLNKYKGQIIRAALRGCLRDGWRSFEVVYTDDQTGIAGIKPLRTDNTKPLVYEDTGAFAGVLNRGSGTDSNEIDIDEQHCIFVNFDDEGYGDLGIPLLRTAYLPYKKWEDCDDGARRYDQKMAGGFLLIQYPEGESPFNESGGANTNNLEIGEAIAEGFRSVGHALVPRRVDPDTGEPLDSVWTVDHIAAGGGMQSGFIEREKYLDALKLRAFGIPERTTTEGTFGTKAEAEAHADIAFIINSDRHARIADAVNDCIVVTLCDANTGDRHCCKLVIGKLDPTDRELFAAIFTSLMSDPVFGEQIASRVDMDTLLEKLNVPVRADAADEDPALITSGKSALDDDDDEDPEPAEKIMGKTA